MPTTDRSEAVARTCFDKMWDQHRIAAFGNNEDVLQLDRLLIHESMGAGVLRDLVAQQREVQAPRQVFSFVDHAVDTEPAGSAKARVGWHEGATQLIEESVHMARRFGLHYIGADDARQGIVHVAAPELGVALPGLTVACPDSHTCTLGGIGAIAWGIGASECLHAVATQTLVLQRPATMRVNLTGTLAADVTAKDVMLHLIGRLGANAGVGHAVEFAGAVVRTLPVEARMTLCNMVVEMSARFGFVAADELTFDYLRDREYAPRGGQWDKAVRHWRALRTDEGARFDREVDLDCTTIEPQTTWGTSPQHVMPVSGRVPSPAQLTDVGERNWAERALSYQKLTPGTAVQDIAIDAAYIGSCTNARLSDLREAAHVLAGRKVAPGVTAICVPGSSRVKAQAEQEGLDRIFRDAGFEWHDAGCGMCANGRDRFKGERIVSTTNRNFENRQGLGSRTHLASPATVAASAIAGRLASARSLAKG